MVKNRIHNVLSYSAGGGNVSTICSDQCVWGVPYRVEAGGFSARSRWLSAAIPPDHCDLHRLHPGRGASDFGKCRGLTLLISAKSHLLASLQDANNRLDLIRWCRCAQPPATGCHASGMKKEPDPSNYEKKIGRGQPQSKTLPRITEVPEVRKRSGALKTGYEAAANRPSVNSTVRCARSATRASWVAMIKVSCVSA